ncbi:MAG: Na/Pi cotransporter family protein [Gammaproteobacteria bacterium]|nr:Na/Pi cotransporter family protein [Gammaproteobacteria bacterium]
MNETIVTVGSVAGGLGLFLLAITLITDGLKFAAGDALSDMLGRWTKTPERGIASGIIITGLVQSSSAVTVATIGFVNAGILSMSQALGVVFGANVGTTMTGWLVAAVGFEFKIEALALPLIGLGMLLRLADAKKRYGAIGLALTGFGLFFIGIDVLKGAFQGIAAFAQVDQLNSDGLSGLLLFIGMGFVITLLTQSSSAAIAIVLTAATGGVISLSAAAAMVIGANVGTTSTAIFAVIGATPNAKRVASAHIIFNLATGAVALVLLPVMLWLVGIGGKAFGLDDNPAVSLALFHTVFNLLGVLLMWPMTAKLAQFLTRRFRSAEEIEGRPRYLDKTVLASPTLDMNAVCLELGHIAQIVRGMAKGAISSEFAPGEKLESNQLAVQQLVQEVDSFVSQLGGASLPAYIAEELPKILRCDQYLSTAAELSRVLATYQSRIHTLGDTELMAALAQIRLALATLIDATDVQHATFLVADCDRQLISFESAYQSLKEKLLVAGAHQRIQIRDMTLTTEQLTRMYQLAEQMVKSARVMAHLFNASNLEYNQK